MSKSKDDLDPDELDRDAFHNKGQEDAASGDYKPPIGIWVGLPSDEKLENDEAYKEGWQHHWDQTHEGCFLTTACLEIAGTSDGSYELERLRWFRDSVLAETEAGAEIIADYYWVAPLLLDAMDSRSDRSSLLTGIWRDIRRAVDLIDKAAYDEATAVYIGMVLQVATTVSPDCSHRLRLAYGRYVEIGSPVAT